MKTAAFVGKKNKRAQIKFKFDIPYLIKLFKLILKTKGLFQKMTLVEYVSVYFFVLCCGELEI